MKVGRLRRRSCYEKNVEDELVAKACTKIVPYNQLMKPNSTLLILITPTM